jgi:16S rRNA (cytidine1402-2'-O)-methyltransferase
MPGTLFVVATPIGNLEDITARALRVLREVALIAAEDTRRTSHLLSRYAITTPTTSLHEHNESQKAASIVERLQRGEDVALVSDAGTPTISDPGQRLVRAAIEAEIRVESIPGPNAALAALAVSGFSIDSFTFMGFPPARSKDRSGWFNEVVRVGGVVVFFEAPHRIRRTLDELHRTAGNCELLVARELTKKHEELVRGPIVTVLQRLAEPLGEYTVVANIGHTTDIVTTEAPSAAELLVEFSVMTKSAHLTKRAAVSALARRHKIAPNAVYNILEAAKKSVE